MSLKVWILLSIIGASTFLNAHGLSMSTAHVQVRNHTHLSMRVEYDPFKLIAKMKGAKAPSLAELASMPRETLNKLYGELKLTLSQDIKIHFGSKMVSLLNFRFLSNDDFAKEVRQKFMKVTMNQSNKHHSHADVREHFINMSVDGFLPKKQKEGTLGIDFPTQLGDVMVTFSKPQTQTIKAEKKVSRYTQHIQL
jgi:hypothetical protein